MQNVLPLLCLFCSKGEKKKKSKVAYPELNKLATTKLVLLEVAFLAILIVLPSREHPISECSLKYLSDLVSEAVFF